MMDKEKEALPTVVEGEIVEATPPIVEVRPSALPSRGARIVERGLALLTSLAKMGLRLLEAREEAAALSQWQAPSAPPTQSTPQPPASTPTPAPQRGSGLGRGRGRGLGRGGRRRRERRRGL